MLLPVCVCGCLHTHALSMMSRRTSIVCFFFFFCFTMSPYELKLGISPRRGYLEKQQQKKKKARFPFLLLLLLLNFIQNGIIGCFLISSSACFCLSVGRLEKNYFSFFYLSLSFLKEDLCCRHYGVSHMHLMFYVFFFLFVVIRKTNLKQTKRDRSISKEINK